MSGVPSAAAGGGPRTRPMKPCWAWFTVQRHTYVVQPRAPPSTPATPRENDHERFQLIA